ncbi:endonuclease MutS2 [Geotoga petraea]|uniref:endonuclease MutS2 n=1 Tax=Geotoga petraea TaxID=28234 RepID=UPI0023EF53B4|nr:endonuclease MutS2 [Geotoga petraea]
MLEKTYRDLEIDKVLGIIGSYSHSVYGKRYLKSKIQFYKNLENLQREIEISRSFFMLKNNQLLFNIKGIPDIKETLEKLKSNSISETKDFRRIAEFHEVVYREYKENNNNFDKNVTDVFIKFSFLRDMAKEIFNAIDIDGEIKDTASELLRNLRSQIKKTKQKIDSLYSSYTNKYSKYLSIEKPVFKNGRLCLAVKAENRKYIKGIFVAKSDSGATYFIEPERISASNEELIDLQNKERNEISRILSELKLMISRNIETIYKNIDVVSYIDYHIAKANYSFYRKADYFIPKKHHKKIYFKDLKHPLLGDGSVPLDIDLENNGMIITGPNTGGKTVTLKSIGVAFFLSHVGLPILSMKAEMPFINSIYTDMGDEQSITQNLSTFSAHLVNINEIIKNADENSLVLIDELGTGTDPIEGSALGKSIIDYLIKKNVKLFITSHLSEIKLYSIENSNLTSASMSFDMNTLKPTYHLMMGVPGASHAIEIASRMGFIKEIIEKATEYISSEHSNSENIFSKISKTYEEMQSNKEFHENKRKQLEKKEREFNKKYELLKDKKIEELDNEIGNLNSQIREAKKEMENLIKNIKYSKNLEEAKNSLKKLENIQNNFKSRDMDKAKNKKIKYNFEKGMKVLVQGNKKGEISEIRGKKAKVNLEDSPIEITYDLSELKPVKKENNRKTSLSDKMTYTPTKKVIPEIDLRGYTVQEAIPEIEKLLSDIMLNEMDEGYIIHGKGSGKLAEGIWDYLRKNKDIKNFRLGKTGEGGSGVTVVEV